MLVLVWRVCGVGEGCYVCLYILGSWSDVVWGALVVVWVVWPRFGVVWWRFGWFGVFV